MAASLLKEFELPLGLLPLVDVIEVGFVRSTGFMWIVQQRKVEHQFKTIDVLVNYDTEIHGYIEKMKVKKLKGVKTKDLIFRPPVIEIKVDETSSEKIHFRSVAGSSKTLPVAAFPTAHTAKKSTLCRIFS